MKEFKIYLSGGMMKFGSDNFNEGNEWRKYCKNKLKESDTTCKVNVFNPNSYYSFKDNTNYDSEREIMNFDLYNLRNSDLVIVNFNDKWSLGTMSEIAIAYDRRIPIIGFNKSNQELHPWQKEFCERIFGNLNYLLNYVVDYYLN